MAENRSTELSFGLQYPFKGSLFQNPVLNDRTTRTTTITLSRMYDEVSNVISVIHKGTSYLAM